MKPKVPILMVAFLTLTPDLIPILAPAINLNAHSAPAEDALLELPFEWVVCLGLSLMA